MVRGPTPGPGESSDLQDELDALIAGLLKREADPSRALALLRRHRLPPSGVSSAVQSRVSELARSDAWRQAVEADRNRVDRVARALELTAMALGPLRQRLALAPSALGGEWARDLDVVVAPDALTEAMQSLRRAGFIDLDPLLRRLGRSTRAFSSFAATDESGVLAAVELVVRGPGLSSIDDVLARARVTRSPLPRLSVGDLLLRRCAKVNAARSPTLRDVLELLALLQAGSSLPLRGDVAVAVRRCAALERRIAGPRQLSAMAAKLPGRSRLGSVSARGHWAYSAARRTLTRTLRRRPVVRIGFSGIDGAGKSTQAELLAGGLLRIGVPAHVHWSRLGSGGTLLTVLAAIRRRLIPDAPHSALVARAAGAPVERLPTRRGILGWTWALVVAFDYLWFVHVARPRGGEVLVYDRALLDALVGLERGYGGAVNLRLQRWLIRRGVPEPDVTFYLRLETQTALDRKMDVFVSAVLEQYVREYDGVASQLARVTSIDARRPATETHRRVLRRLAELAD